MGCLGKWQCEREARGADGFAYPDVIFCPVTFEVLGCTMVRAARVRP